MSDAVWIVPIVAVICTVIIGGMAWETYKNDAKKAQ